MRKEIIVKSTNEINGSQMVMMYEAGYLAHIDSKKKIIIFYKGFEPNEFIKV